MASAYTPGLQVTANTQVSRLRELPCPGAVTVAVGDKVAPDTKVLRAELPGEIDIIRLTDRLGFEPEEVLEHLLVKEGDKVERGQLLCEIKTFFGLFTSRYNAQSTGVVEFITETNAHIGLRHAPIPLEVQAFLRGVVTEIDPGKSVTISTKGSLIQGIFGVGGERSGQLLTLHGTAEDEISPQTLEPLRDKLNGAVLLGGARFSEAALRIAAEAGVNGVITGSIDATTLRQYVGFEIGVSITGDENVPFTLIITEGFGRLTLSPRIMKLAEQLDGKEVSIKGATQVRAGAMRPEMIVPDPEAFLEDVEHLLESSLHVGSTVRVIRVPFFGEFAEVVELPNEPETVPSGAVVRVLRLKRSSGEVVTVPRANVEIIAS